LLNPSVRADQINVVAGPTLQLVENGLPGTLSFSLADATSGSTVAVALAPFTFGAFTDEKVGGSDSTDVPTLVSEAFAAAANVITFQGTVYAILTNGGANATVNYVFAPPTDNLVEPYAYDDWLELLMPNAFTACGYDATTKEPEPGSTVLVNYNYTFPALPNGGTTGLVGVTDEPEPSTIFLATTGLVGITCLLKRARQRKA
jgi:hypothetical protein